MGFIKKFKISNVAKAGIWFTISNLLLKGINLLTIPLFTHIMTEDEYGLLGQYISIQQLILIIASWDISYGAYQKGLFKYSEDERLFTASTTIFTTLMSSVTFSVLFLFYGVIGKYILIPRNILFILYIYTLFQPAYRNWIVKKQKDHIFKPVVCVTFFVTLGGTLFAILSVLFVSNTANMKFSADMMWAIPILLVFYVISFKGSRVFKSIHRIKEYLKYIIGYQFPCILHSLSLIILGQADRLMIGQMIGNTEAAYYTIAYNLASVMAIAQTSIEQTLIPWRYKKIEEKNYSAIRYNTNAMLIFIGGAILTFVLIAPEVLMVFPKSYWEAKWCIPPVALGSYFCFLYSIFVSIEAYHEKTWYILIVSVICGIGNIVMNYYVIGYFGYVGCSYTTLISYVLFSLGHFIFARKIIIDNGIDKEIFDIKRIIIISVALSITIFVLMLLYEMILVRYFMLAGIIIGAYLFRKKIINIIKEIKNK